MIPKCYLAAVALALLGPSWAAAENGLPSCYDPKLGVTAAPPMTELFVLVDQTTAFDKTLQQQVADNVRPFMEGGNAYSVISFSAFAQGRYAQVLSTGTIEPGIAPALRDDISKPLLAKFDSCTKRQPALAMNAIGNALRTAFSGADPSLAKSDVMGSLKAISGRVKKSVAKEKIVLVASDMLENSAVSSFYGPRGTSVRQIDAAKEMKLAADNELFGDFGGAKIFVIGAGLLAAEGQTKGAYRDPKTMRALVTFWNSYFQRSHATVVELGQPALLNSITDAR